MQNPQHLETASLHALALALAKLDSGFAGLPPFSGSASKPEELERVLAEAAQRMQNNYPYFHPLYAGQMLKPPHPVARAAYALAMWINPNNHALDGGRASSAMEKEAVAEIAAMFGWKEHLGHLTGGGTMANLEALWISSQVQPGVVLASTQAHYTHSRISGVLGLRFESIGCDRLGRMDVAVLEQRLKAGGIGTVVATIGTTAIGSVDPLPQLLELREKYNFRLHADAAYGGYFILADNLDAHARNVFDLLSVDCSPTAAVAFCFVIRRSAGSTNTIRRTRISARAICISAKSVWNARAPERQQLHCGQRRSCFR
jgi:tyrosine decarboxylase/aspartate 1-decarboxylase